MRLLCDCCGSPRSKSATKSLLLLSPKVIPEFVIEMEPVVQYLFKSQKFHALFEGFLRVQFSIEFISLRPGAMWRQSVPGSVQSRTRTRFGHCPRDEPQRHAACRCGGDLPGIDDGPVVLAMAGWQQPARMVHYRRPARPDERIA